MLEQTLQSTLLQRLEDSLISRNIRAGFALLDDAFGRGQRLDYRDPDAIAILLCVAEWTDLGYRDIAFLDVCLAVVPGDERVRLPFLDFLRLRLVEAFRFFAREDLDRAISLLDTVLRAGEGLLPPHMVFIANFWKGRTHRKKGEYELALFHIAAARKSAQDANAPKLVAVTKIHESWLVFQKGERRHALNLLDEAEDELRVTGHALSLGNIESARGRFIRRSGDYTLALEHFERAIAIFSETQANHPNLARALVNAAYVKRLIALDMQAQWKGEHVRGAVHAEYLQVLREALQLLRKARDIYALHQYQGGIASVLINAGHLHLESGETDEAFTESEEAFALAQERHDVILMARSRILQAAVELAHAEELGESPGTAFHAHRAVQYADEAIELAQQTQNRRMLAGAYLARGSAAADYFPPEWEVARDYASKAAALLTEDDRDHLVTELSRLKAKILRSTGIDQTLRLWSDGQLGNKTFQQIQEEFAELVIPKVWNSVGKNVTLVAQKLSISPKKIRRILRNTGFMDGSKKKL
jgi:tetratricopeptide (TPR) repeat protein